MTDAPPRITRLLQPWHEEPGTVDESSFSPLAPAGWTAWNAYSPELEMCETAAQLVRMVRPTTVVETGIGQGYTTRRVAAALPEGATYHCFESDDDLRTALAGLPWFADHAAVVLSPLPTPPDEVLATADLTILDSGSDHRHDELRTWRRVARPEAFLLVHDTGNGHPEWTPHHRLRLLIEELAVPGVFLTNPRGAFLGQQR